MSQMIAARYEAPTVWQPHREAVHTTSPAKDNSPSEIGRPTILPATHSVDYGRPVLAPASRLSTPTASYYATTYEPGSTKAVKDNELLSMTIPSDHNLNTQSTKLSTAAASRRLKTGTYRDFLPEDYQTAVTHIQSYPAERFTE